MDLIFLQKIIDQTKPPPPWDAHPDAD